jgi:hypothetical protein
MNGELERMWNEAVVAYFKVITSHFTEKFRKAMKY